MFCFLYCCKTYSWIFKLENIGATSVDEFANSIYTIQQEKRQICAFCPCLAITSMSHVVFGDNFRYVAEFEKYEQE